eukprot:747747-Hanusia_phi.AAC.4
MAVKRRYMLDMMRGPPTGPVTEPDARARLPYYGKPRAAPPGPIDNCRARLALRQAAGCQADPRPGHALAGALRY